MNPPLELVKHDIVESREKNAWAGPSGGSRTPDRSLRRRVLYPTELLTARHQV